MIADTIAPVKHVAEQLWRLDLTPAFRRQELCYGSPEFLEASDWVRSLPDHARARTVLASLALHPALVRVLLAIWRLPVIELRIRKRDADAWWFGHWFAPGLRRLGRAVLVLPGDEARYLAGHPRRILRNKLGHARTAGVTSMRVGYDTWRKAAADVLHARGAEPGPDTASHARPVAYYVARDDLGTPLAFSSAALFDQFAVLFINLSRGDRRPEASWARYQLHTCLALDLGSRGVRYLLTGSALRESAGIQYFQHVLGYEVCNLRVQLVLAMSSG